MKILSERLLYSLDYKYVLSYKFSQDHLELLFSCIRARGGRNNNPNVVQFRIALRQLMYRNRVQASEGSNCFNFDEHHQNSVFSFSEPFDGNNSNDESESFEENMPEINVDARPTSYYTDNILHYISGYVVRKVDKFMQCAECTKCLHNMSLSPPPVHNKLTSLISLGYLVNVSNEVFSLVKYLYTVFKVNKDRPNYNSKKIVLKACMFFENRMFKSHPFYIESGAEHHGLRLMKLIGTLFLKVISFSHCKEKNESMNLSKLGMRHKLSKVILFQNI